MSVCWPITNADQVRAYISVTGAACPRCGYCLHGLRDPVCPECGKQLSIAAFTRTPWYRRLKTGPVSSLRLAAGLNVIVAAAIMVSALAHRGNLPILSWLAPGVLGAFAFSIQYLAVFAKYCPVRYDPIERWGEGVAWMALVVQVAGLVLMWV